MRIRLLEFADKKFNSNCNSNAINIAVHDIRQSSASNSLSFGKDYLRQDIPACKEISISKRDTEWNIFGGAIQFKKPPENLMIRYQSSNESFSEAKSNRENSETVTSEVMTGSVTEGKLRHRVRAMKSPVESRILAITKSHISDDDEYLEAEVFV